jgi:predicted dehydrogenase
MAKGEGKMEKVGRREFVKNAALGAVGLLILRNAKSAYSYQANEKLNIACVGVGGHGWSNLMAVSSENIVSLCDVDEQHASQAFNRYPDVPKFADFREMLDKMHNQIDAVVVTTPDHTHAVISVAAMKLGKHVYCEKPLTRTVYEARVMRETAAKQKVVTQMGNQGSATEGLRRAVELAWAGVIGEIREAHVWFGGGNHPVDRPSEEPQPPAGFNWDL